MAWFSLAARAQRRGRSLRAELAALGRVALSAEEAEVLVPHVRALLRQLALALPAGGAAHAAVARLQAVQPGDVDGLRVWLAQVRLACVPLRYPAAEAPPPPVGALAGDLRRAADGWGRAQQREAAAGAAFAGARGAGHARGPLLLAIALSLVPFAISDCMDSARALRAAAAEANADGEGCADGCEADTAAPRPI